MMDISLPWHETACGICEINAQPQLGSITSAHLYPLILKKLVPQGGRTPIFLVIGNDALAVEIAEKLAARLKTKDLVPGVYIQRKVFINDELVATGLNAWEAGQALISNPQVDAIIIQAADMSFGRLGLPFDRYNSLLVTDMNTVERSNRQPVSEKERISMIEMILPACTGSSFTLEKSPLQNRDDLETISTSETIKGGPLADSLCEEILA